jgi:hypothetical protein
LLTFSTGRYILIKLFNNFYDPADAEKKAATERQERPPRVLTWTGLTENNIPPPGDPLRFDNIDDDMEEERVTVVLESDDHDPDEFENVDVQSILFYGYTGRRCFPSIKDL